MKVKLEITAVEPVASFGDSGKKVAFTANGKPHVCYKPSLFALIQEGKTIEGDVEEKETQRGLERRLTGIEGVGGGQGGRSYGKSPDERASIERQVAVKEVGEALRIGMPVMPEIQAAYWRIVAGWLNAPQSESQGAASTRPIPPETPRSKAITDEVAELDRNFEGTMRQDSPPETQPEGQETASKTLDHIPGRSEDMRAALLVAGESLEWTGNVSTGDGHIRPGKEWWEKFAHAANIAKVEVALANAYKMLEEKANGE